MDQIYRCSHAINRSLRDWLWLAALLFLLFGCASSPSTSQAVPPTSFRLWCPSPEGFYPQVASCPSGWQRQASLYQQGEAKPPLLMTPVPPPPEEESK